ncbi:terminase small subunit [Rahnella inusitata]|uniref:terminase small subunit n=1 Tax=Rahnella inusitata TaxID=58169 RepID=UPI0039BE728F
MLTGQKRRFAIALMSGSTQAAAAIKAGYSEKSARSKGSQLAKDPDVIAYMHKTRGVEESANPEVPKQKVEPEKMPVVNTLTGDFDDPLDFLKSIMNDRSEGTDVRKDAAKAMLPYVHAKKGEGGKKDAKLGAAKAAHSKFSGMAPPKLVVNNKG